MALVPRTYSVDLAHTGKKWGDVDKEKQIEERVKQLGLYESKKAIENQLALQLNSAIDQDTIMGIINHTQARRRTRSLPDRARAIICGIRNVIRHKVVRDGEGKKTLYHVDILMGLFTKDVYHAILDKEVLVQGTTPNGIKLSKEIRVEFPETVELSKVLVSYSGGVVKIEAPFTDVNTPSSSRWASTNSEESMSFASETDSDVFSLTPEPD